MENILRAKHTLKAPKQEEPGILKDWSAYEIIWLVAFMLVAGIAEIVCNDSIFGYSVFLSGVLCVLLAARGDILTFAFGIYNTLGYAFIAYQSGLFGEMGLNLFFFLPMNVIGLLAWKRNLSDKRVEMRGLDAKRTIELLMGCAAGILLLGWALACIPGQNSPLIDASTNVLSIIATVLMTLRYREQWILYIILDGSTVLMWVLRLAAGAPDAGIMVVTWCAYLVNAFYGYIIWSKGASRSMKEKR